jgi:hypothetical protein
MPPVPKRPANTTLIIVLLVVIVLLTIGLIVFVALRG